MTHVEWDQFNRSINPAFKATVAPEQLVTLMSATEGRPVTTRQLYQLVTLDTDVIEAGGVQYALNNTCAGLKLSRLVRPVTPDDAPVQKRVLKVVPA